MKFTKKTIIILAVAVVAALVAYNSFRPKGPAYKTEAVTRGDIVQEVSETGTVKRGETVNLSFQNSGTVAKIYVQKGDEVRAGQLLAELDTNQLEVQARQAQASLDLAKVQRDKLLNGASESDIKIAQTAVINAQSSLDSAKLALRDAQDNADRKMDSLYKSALDVLNSAYAKASNASNSAALLQRTYFNPQDSDSIAVTVATRAIGQSVTNIKLANDGVKANYQKALSDTALELEKISDQLGDIRAICEKTAWRDVVSAADKADIATQRDYVNAALAAVNSARQNIDLQESANELAINNAQAGVTAAEGLLNTSGESLSKITSDPRQEDVQAINAQVDQAQAQVELLGLQIEQSRLKAPIDGQIGEINYHEGESVQSLIAAGGAMTLIPHDPYVVETDIYEEDIAKIELGDVVTISPASNPEDIFPGSVILIDPASKVVNGVVYYSVRIAFDEVPDSVKTGMSADVTIITAKAENTLLVSESALKKGGQGYYVRVLQDGEVAETPVAVGIKSKGEAQIISGVNEGVLVVID